LLLSRPDHHPHKITATFPRVRLHDDQVSEALERCLREKVGVECHSAYPLPQIWTSEHSSTFVVAGVKADASKLGAAAGTNWYAPGEARRHLHASPNVGTRHRDVGILDAVSRLSLSPSRRILLMVRELHDQGFQRLRVVSGTTAGLWQCAVVPATCISGFNDAELDLDGLAALEKACRGGYRPYRSDHGQQPWGWTDAHFDNPMALARKFVERFPALAFAGWGRDEPYARWFREMLVASEPNGLPVLHDGRLDLPGDHLCLLHSPRVLSFPLPPGVAYLQDLDLFLEGTALSNCSSNWLVLPPNWCPLGFLVAYAHVEKLLFAALRKLDPTCRSWNPVDPLETNLETFMALDGLEQTDGYWSTLRLAKLAIRSIDSGKLTNLSPQEWERLLAGWRHIEALLQ
jgi:hypothetical protein